MHIFLLYLNTLEVQTYEKYSASYIKCIRKCDYFFLWADDLLLSFQTILLGLQSSLRRFWIRSCLCKVVSIASFIIIETKFKMAAVRISLYLAVYGEYWNTV